MGHEKTKDRNTSERKTKEKLQCKTPTPCPPPTPCYNSTTLDLPHPPTICNYNTMDIEFLVQMRQFDECGSVRNDEIFSLHPGSGASP